MNFAGIYSKQNKFLVNKIILWKIMKYEFFLLSSQQLALRFYRLKKPLMLLKTYEGYKAYWQSKGIQR